MIETRNSTEWTIGSRWGARLALAAHVAGERATDRLHCKYLASGAYRATYLDPSDGGTVYKVDRDPRDGGNRDEFHAAQDAYESGIDGIPAVTLYTIGSACVIAMPYFPNSSSHAGPREPSQWYATFADLHSANWRRDSLGTPYVTDMQFREDGEGGECYTCTPQDATPTEHGEDDICDCSQCEQGRNVREEAAAAQRANIERLVAGGVPQNIAWGVQNDVHAGPGERKEFDPNRSCWIIVTDPDYTAPDPAPYLGAALQTWLWDYEELAQVAPTHDEAMLAQRLNGVSPASPVTPDGRIHEWVTLPRRTNGIAAVDRWCILPPR